ncbi:MAG: archease [Candidatus Sungbacteria bacterium]|nr:archease [bacterium]MDZ4285881.1 archease [Candidatus Sungbacteria bacterium]
MDKTQGFELLPHVADIHMRAWGKTIKELFCNALQGTASLMQPSLSHTAVVKKEKQGIRVDAVDINSLLVEFLSKVTALSDIHNMVFTHITFKTLGDNFLEAELSGTHIDGFEKEIKAVSYHEVDIKRNSESGLYETTLVFDI